MKEIQKSEYAIARLPLGVAFEGFDLEIEDFMITVYWGGCRELKKANIDFPKIENHEEYMEHGLDFRHVTSEQILKEKPDDVNIVTVIYEDFMEGAVLQYGNYSDCWVMLGRLNGFA